jgi:hypothetical protein
MQIVGTSPELALEPDENLPDLFDDALNDLWLAEG